MIAQYDVNLNRRWQKLYRYNKIQILRFGIEINQPDPSDNYNKVNPA